MFAVIEAKGKQYRVEPGDLIKTEKIDGEPGGKVVFDKVLLVGGSESPLVGNPTVTGCVVEATLIETRKGPKVLVGKFKRRKKYRRKKGHRQWYSKVKIDNIVLPT
jgi:large subunit ribosomal protein L21